MGRDALSSSTGEIYWTKYYNMEGYDFYEGRCAIQGPNGKILVSGIVEGKERQDVFILTLDETGNRLGEMIIPVYAEYILCNEIILSGTQYKLIYEYWFSNGFGYISSDTMRIVTLDEDLNILKIQSYNYVICTGQILSQKEIQGSIFQG